jgi:hypothetical protein
VLVELVDCGGFRGERLIMIIIMIMDFDHK